VKQAIIIGLLLLLCQRSHACDICGAFSINQRAGLLTGVNADFISLAYAHVSFKGGNLSYDKDVFHRWQLSGQYHLSARWALGFSQSYALNQRVQSEKNISIEGFGNTTLQGFYKILQQDSKGSKISWRTGLGVQFPNGKFDNSIHDLNVPENFNPSDGTWGVQWVNDFTWTSEEFGLLLNTQGLYRFIDSDQGRWGHQISTSLNAFYHISNESSWTLVPFSGISYDWSGANHFGNGKEDSDTGGQTILAQAGINMDNQKWGFNFQVAFPVIFKLKNPEIKPGPRWTLQFNYFI